jgi:DNA polymerase-3 subunit gamma/tau
VQKPVTQPITTNSGSSLKIPSSLKAFQKGIGSVKSEPASSATTGAAPTPNTSSQIIGEAEYSLASFKQEWTAFAEQMRSNHKMLSATALSQLPAQQSPDNWLLKVSSIAIQEEVEKVKPELLQHLRIRLNNKNIRLEVMIDEMDSGRQLYTNTEKLNYLVKQYPKLAELRDRLGLEADF